LVTDNGITDIPGVKVGNYTDREGMTGCTVILCESGAVAGVDVSGAAPGTRETDVLRPGNLVEKAHAVLLSGGSAFGLEAAGGVMRYLEERGVGHQTAAGKVPIVPAAVIYDLIVGSPKARPGADDGYQACLAATAGEVPEGCVGAGTGAAVGKILGMERATKSGLGTASQQIGDGVIVAALVVENAFGDVVHPRTGEIIAGPRRPHDEGFLSTAELLKGGQFKGAGLLSNTTIGVVATNARLDKAQANKLAEMAGGGIARTVDPYLTMFDGDAIFALSLGEKKCDLTLLGLAAAEVVSTAIIRAIVKSETMAGIAASKAEIAC
jgi:L-aminopeptidase/D-esterase-like protein